MGNFLVRHGQFTRLLVDFFWRFGHHFIDSSCQHSHDGKPAIGTKKGLCRLLQARSNVVPFSQLKPWGNFFVVGRLRAFAGSPLLPGAGPAGLRWLLKSPPRHAGQSPATLAGNPAQSLPQATCIKIQFQFLLTFKGLS